LNSTFLDLVLIYRSPSVSYPLLCTELEVLLQSIEHVQKKLVLGDFNIDALAP